MQEPHGERADDFWLLDARVVDTRRVADHLEYAIELYHNLGSEVHAWRVWRRYKDFHQVRQALRKANAVGGTR